MCPRTRLGDEAAARHGYVTDGFYADQSCVEMDNLRSRRGEKINGVGTRVGMRALHMHNALVFGGFEFRQMGVYCRRLARVRVHMEKRGVEHRHKKGWYCDAGRYSSHAGILMPPGFEVNSSSGTCRRVNNACS